MGQFSDTLSGDVNILFMELAELNFRCVHEFSHLRGIQSFLHLKTPALKLIDVLLYFQTDFIVACARFILVPFKIGFLQKGQPVNIFNALGLVINFYQARTLEQSKM